LNQPIGRHQQGLGVAVAETESLVEASSLGRSSGRSARARLIAACVASKLLDDCCGPALTLGLPRATTTVQEHSSEHPIAGGSAKAEQFASRQALTTGAAAPPACGRQVVGGSGAGPEAVRIEKTAAGRQDAKAAAAQRFRGRSA